MASCVAKLIQATAANECVNKSPGLTRLLLAEKKWIATIPAPEDYNADPVANGPLEISGDITFDAVTYPEAGWKEVPVQVQKTNLQPVSQGEPGAKSWGTRLAFSYAGHAPLLDQHVDWLQSAYLVALVMDTAGRWVKVGDLNTPAEVDVAEGTWGPGPTDFSGWNIELLVPAHPNLWPYYTGAVTPLAAL